MYVYEHVPTCISVCVSCLHICLFVCMFVCFCVFAFVRVGTHYCSTRALKQCLAPYVLCSLWSVVFLASHAVCLESSVLCALRAGTRVLCFLCSVVVCYGVVSSCVCAGMLPDLCVGVQMFKCAGETVSWSAGEKVGCYGPQSLWFVGKGLCLFFCCSVVALMRCCVCGLMPVCCGVVWCVRVCSGRFTLQLQALFSWVCNWSYVTVTVPVPVEIFQGGFQNIITIN